MVMNGISVRYGRTSCINIISRGWEMDVVNKEGINIGGIIIIIKSDILNRVRCRILVRKNISIKSNMSRDENMASL